MVAAASWMYVVDWGPWIWQMLCKSFAYDIERYFWRVVDSIWSFVVSETKTKWNVYCVARQYHDSRYVHWIRRIYTRAVILLPVAAFFNAFPTAAKGSLTEGNDQLLKTTSNLFFAPLNGFVYLCLSPSLLFTSSQIVEFFLILNTTAITRNVTVTSGNVCVQSGWQLPVEAVLDLIVYLSKGITILQTKQRYREVTNINIS